MLKYKLLRGINMDQDVNKFILVAYEKDNISNRSIQSAKSFLSTIDMYTSQYLYSEFYDHTEKVNTFFCTCYCCIKKVSLKHDKVFCRNS